MKFKVGDKVRIKKDFSDNRIYKISTNKMMEKYAGKIMTIRDVGCDYYLMQEDIKDRDWREGWMWTEDMFEKELFTKSDLKDGDIVTQRDGYQKVVCAGEKELRGINECTYLQMENYTTNLLDKDKDTNFDIIKVERPTGYETVFERKEEILDEVEKRYLRDVIRPFRKDIKNITKFRCSGRDEYFIKIRFQNNETLNFPNFTDKTMYKGMKADKEYTLEELGL